MVGRSRGGCGDVGKKRPPRVFRWHGSHGGPKEIRTMAVHDDNKSHNRDKPLCFHWRGNDEAWIEDLVQQRARSRNHDKARRAIILDAVLVGIAEPGRWISYSRRHDWWSTGQRYRGTAFTCATVSVSVDELHRLGLVESQVAAPRTRGWQSRLRATPALIEAARPALVFTPSGAPAVIYEPRELIRLKDANGTLIDYDDTRRRDAMRRELREDNEALRATDVDLPAEAAARDGSFFRIGGAVLNRGIDVMHRVFSRRSFAFNGRHTGPWWQGVPKDLRRHLTINGESTVELDYGGQHLRMLYAQEGVPLGDGDPYMIDGWERDLVKRTVMALINAGSEDAAVAVICDARKGPPTLTGPGAHAWARKLIEDIKRRHAPVAHRFHQDQGIRLMRQDSELVVAILRAMRRRGVVVLPIYDSFISDARHRDHLREEMEAAWHRQIGKEKPAISMLCAEDVPHIPPVVVVVVPVGLPDLFGGRPVPEALLSWSGGAAPAEARRFLRDEIRDRHLCGADLARTVKISRPHLANVLNGRFGTTPRVAEALKSWALAGR
jgi:hypothetical protein